MANQQEEIVPYDYEDTLEPGYRFCPTDLEIIVYYLKQKIETGEHPQCRIYEVYIYDYNPDELAEKHRSCGNKWYFLTSRERMCPQGNRPKRIAKNYGFWRTSQTKSKVYDERGAVVGYKRSLAFYVGKNDKTEWLMHEYTTNDPNLPFGSGTDGNKLNDWVLCKIYKKETSQNANNIRANHVQYARNQEKEKEEQNQAHDKRSRKRQRPSVNNQGINQPNCSEPQHVQVQEATHYHSGSHAQEPVQSVFSSSQQLANNIDTSGGQMELLNQTSYANHDFSYNHHDTIHPMDTFCGSNFIQQPEQVFPLEVAPWNSTYEYHQNQSMCGSSSTSNESLANAAAVSSQPIRTTSLMTSQDLPPDAVYTPQLDDDYDKDFLNPGISIDEMSGLLL